MIVAMVIALASSFCFAMAFVSQQHVAGAVPEDRGRGVRLFLELARSPLWWAGFLGDIGGFALQALALAFGSIVLVQPLLVTAVVMSLPLAARWNGRRITRSDLLWASTVVAALAVFCLVARPRGAGFRPTLSEWALPGGTLMVVVVAALVVAWFTRATGRSAALGVATGLMYGLVAALTDVCVHVWDRDGFAGVFACWEFYALVVAMVSGSAMQQGAFHAGALAASLPATQVLEPIAGVALGLTVLGATMAVVGWQWFVVGAALAAMVAGTFALARSAARTARGADDVPHEGPREPVGTVSTNLGPSSEPHVPT